MSALEKSFLNERITQLLDRHAIPSQRGFIMRLDRSSISSKRMIFLQSLAHNFFVLFCISIFATATLDHRAYIPPAYSFLDQVYIVSPVKAVILFAAAVLFHSTIFPFLWWECRLRYRFGFQETEMYIIALPEHLHPEVALNGLPQGLADDEAWRRRWVEEVVEATHPRYLYYRPSSLLVERYWTPHYAAMWMANSLMRGGELGAEDFASGIWLRELGTDKGGWAFIEFGGVMVSS
ncbi:hypothetical protein BKA70DRAFT_1316768 [Coprinopsis sp. MPI-PUGE-AT-0042]|nr:hypothetical protein BKA70DRAFT_1316768 [Coprinopsis sp. MPI-PUGE-AT-0042]